MFSRLALLGPGEDIQQGIRDKSKTDERVRQLPSSGLRHETGFQLYLVAKLSAFLFCLSRIVCLTDELADQTVHSINFTHEGSFADPAERWVAAHFSDGVGSLGEEKRASSSPSRSGSSFTSCMASANDLQLCLSPCRLASFLVVAYNDRELLVRRVHILLQKGRICSQPSDLMQSRPERPKPG